MLAGNIVGDYSVTNKIHDLTPAILYLTSTTETKDIDKSLKFAAYSVKEIPEKIGMHSSLSLKIDHAYADDLIKLKKDMLVLKAEATKLSDRKVESSVNFKMFLAESKQVENTLDNLIKYSVKATYDSDEDVFLKKSVKTKLRDELRMNIFGKNLDWSTIQIDPLAHPEWSIFHDRLYPFIQDESELKELWTLLIDGIFEQKKLIEKDQKHEINISFLNLANKLSNFGLLSRQSTNKQYALWSGGYDVSLYARQNDFLTLEKTPAGEILDDLVLYPAWGPIGQLWNAISDKFTDGIDDDVHVFFRVHDPLSVLERKEILKILGKRNLKMVFHPLVNKKKSKNPLDMLEIESSKGLESRRELKDYLVKICQSQLKKTKDADLYEKNIIAIKAMKLD